MLYKRLGRLPEICVLRVGVNVLDIEGAVISDGNASSDYTRFAPASSGTGIVDKDATFALNWRDADQYAYWDKKRRKCAEVLVPELVSVDHIVGVYVGCDEAVDNLNATGAPIHTTVNEQLFFQ